MRWQRIALLFVLFYLLVGYSYPTIENIPPPDEVLGFKVGEDYKLANWTQILDYFDKLSSASPRVKVIDLERTTLDRKFIMAVISSPENLNNLDELKHIQKRLHDPRNLSPTEQEELVKKGRAVVFISCSLHSSEIAASQMSMELAYKLATDETSMIQQILDNIVLLLVPSLNPDGIDIVSNWYFQNLGTPFEKSPLPRLYHHYVGHDNNRDWFMLSQKETQIVTKVLYKDWFPLLVYDVHQMRTHGPRLFIPPFYDPVNPNIDPLLLRELNLLSNHAAAGLTKAGKTGVATNWNFELWRGMGCRSVPVRHNAMGILSEAASVNIASPLFIEIDKIKIEGKGIRGTGIQTNYLEPWQGGWWRIRDIIDYEEIVAFSFLQTIAKDKSRYLSNYALFARRQIEKGKNESPYAYVVPSKQNDLPTACKMLEILQKGGAEIFQAQKPFIAEKAEYPAYTFIIPLAQPYRAHIKDLMEVKPYPLILNDGIPELPRDEISWTLPLQMGVKAVEIEKPFEAETKLLQEVKIPSSKIQGEGSKYFLFSNRTNNESMLINRLLNKGIKCSYTKEAFDLEGRSFTPGAVVVAANDLDRTGLSTLIKDLGIRVYAHDKEPSVKRYSLVKSQVGIYQSWIPNKDEGWLRWTLDQFEFQYTLLHNADIKSGNLYENYSHIILPSMSEKALLEGRKEGEIPDPYVGGIGEKGLLSLKEFVEKGGRLISIFESVDSIIKFFDLPVKNLIDYQYLRKGFEDPSPPENFKDEFFCPGALMNAQVNNNHPVGFGMDAQRVIFNYFNPAFIVEKGERIVSYPHNIESLSGIALNKERILGKAALVECPLGQGSVLLFGFKPIHRAQAHGTFKFVFNSLFY